jgi:hypothetical protein
VQALFKNALAGVLGVAAAEIELVGIATAAPARRRLLQAPDSGGDGVHFKAVVKATEDAPAAVEAETKKVEADPALFVDELRKVCIAEEVAVPAALSVAVEEVATLAVPVPGPAICELTTCTYKDGTTLISTQRGSPKWHCEKVGAICKCVCDASLKCTLRHHISSGYKKNISHC